ncbi:putative hydrolase [Podospora australis]|uniref:Hydrolase n=1 Tax=Podospora australis TaxID=1536484 RepID=A0AAN6WTE5_9PEZI|nr:putative hydrolase [Podospora australis]
MIDHVLGRPSVKSRRLQVLAVLGFWSAYLFKGNKHGPPFSRFLSRWLSKKLTAWQTVVITMIYLYAARNFSTLVGLGSPDPLANMYDATYFRATWILTALDAGFWTAMPIKQKWLRDIASMVFSVFYMVAAEKADEKVRKVRATVTVDHLRVSWNKGVQSPYLRFMQDLVRPRFTKWPPRAIRIHRPSTSDYKEPVSAWLYYDGPLSELKYHNKIILDIPGGGFVAMDPRCNDDKLFSWAAKTGLPILSLDYKKAPEYPYPYALNECYDVYCTIIRTRGKCIGLSGDHIPRVVITGDSAGGTLATSTTIMITESGSSPIRRFQGQTDLPVPDGLILFYPALDMNIGSWMSDEQMTLIKDRRMRGTNKRVLARKTMQYNDLVGTPHQSDDEDDTTPPTSKSRTSLELHEDDDGLNGHVLSPAPQYAHSGPTTWSHTQLAASPAGPATPEERPSVAAKRKQSTSHHPEPMRTRLAMSSMISYFSDRVLTPEMMRAMIILYVGPHNRPDFTQDYLLCPILAPDVLLARFPKTYFLTGERDPLVDDTVIFAGRLRRVKAAQTASNGTRYEYRDTDAQTPGFDENLWAEVALIPGISHGFLQFPTVYPPAWGLFEKISHWMEDVFLEAERRERRQSRMSHLTPSNGVDVNHNGRHHFRRESAGATSLAASSEDGGLEIAMTKVRTRGRSLPQPSNNNEKGLSGKASAREDALEKWEGAIPPKVEVNGHHHTNGEDNISGSGSGSGSGGSGNTSGTHGGPPPKRKERRRVRTKDADTLVKRLASSDDLLGRRMQGLAGSLTGLPADHGD